MTREQKRAAQAFEDVTYIKNKTNDEMPKRYATVVYQLIILIRTAGLIQALEFIENLSHSGKQSAGSLLLDSLGKQMGRFDDKIKDGHTLREYVRNAELGEYLILSREVMAAMVWYKRFVQSVLKINETDTQND